MGRAGAICTANTAADPDSNTAADPDPDSDSDSDSTRDHDSGSDCDSVLQSIPGMGPADVYNGVCGLFNSSTRAYASTHAHAYASTIIVNTAAAPAAAAALASVTGLSRR